MAEYKIGPFWDFISIMMSDSVRVLLTTKKTRGSLNNKVRLKTTSDFPFALL